MKRAELEHILRACKGETEFIVIGSQAILGRHPDAPRVLRKSMEADLASVVERKACGTGCCKLTLEVQENNLRARRLCEACGFSQAQSVEAAGRSIFLWKRLQGE